MPFQATAALQEESMKQSVLYGALMLWVATPALAADSNQIDKEFATTIAQGGMAEVQAGKLATDKASDASVKQFAQRMVTDHSKANDTFAAVAKQEGLSLPAETDPDHEAALKKLAAAEKATFDSEYMKAQVT